MKGRLLSLDIMRGITVAGMIVVNNAGGPLSYAALRHAEWNGLTPCDLVFPSFLFIMGISTYISLQKYNFQFTKEVVGKILKRTIFILLIGWAIHWFALICKGDYLPFDHLRLTGVLPRIALCYCITSFIAIRLPHKSIKWIVIILLAIYTILLFAGNGYTNNSTNLLARIDHWLLSDSHLYTKRPIDPEGIVSSISAIAHCLIGFCIGRILLNKSKGSTTKISKSLNSLLLISICLLLSGLLLAEIMPLNKRIWSPSFVLVTCSIAIFILTILLYIIDIKGHKQWGQIFEVFGVNPLFLYIASEMLAILLSTFGVKSDIYNAIHAFITNPYLASAFYSILFTLFMELLGFLLYKRKIYIKL